MDFEPDVWYYGKYHTDGSCLGNCETSSKS